MKVKTMNANKKVIARYINSLNNTDICIDCLVDYVHEFSSISRKTIIQYMRELKTDKVIQYYIVDKYKPIYKKYII